MALRFAGNTRLPRPDFWKFWFSVLALLLVGSSLAACNDTCFSITSNPPNGNINIKVGDPKPTCTLTVTKAAVRVITRAVSTCDSCAPSNQVRRIVLNLRGIEVHPGAIADKASPDWQELLPGTSPRGLQFDLSNVASALASHQTVTTAVAIPAGTYRQLRLRFAPNTGAAKEMLSEKGSCEDAGPNCVVMGDGHVLPILLDGAEPELRPRSDSGFLFPPDSSSDLVIEFGISWLLSKADGQGSRLLPALTARVSVERSPGGLAAE